MTDTGDKMETTEKKPATKKTVLLEAKVCCEPHYTVTRWERTEEAKAKALEAWCKDFNAFIRDHRHQDGTHLSVDRIYEDRCSACEAVWEPTKGIDLGNPEVYEDDKMYCASCGEEVAK